jgi:hypothetical protein
MAYDREAVSSNPGIVYWMDVSILLVITLKKTWKYKKPYGAHQKTKEYFKDTSYIYFINMFFPFPS